ncbi:MAG: TetR/AcrR family transcriptional regulator [Spirochaetia bacterium]|jgi:AcrR family transcriptional regulator
MSQKTGNQSRPLRADAQKNYAHLLDVAHAVFMKKGPDASLEEIARKAEVGIGTLYRHFPTRTDLLESVYAEQIEGLIARAYALRDTLPPREALLSFLDAAAEHMMTYKALKACLISAGEGAMKSHKQWAPRLYDAVGALLAAAEKAGVVRSGLEPMDLMKLVHAITVAAEKSPDSAAQVKRLLGIMTDGLVSKS